MKRTLIIVAASEPARVDEALRAALGVTLRGARVTVWLDDARPLGPQARRAVAALQSFGHEVVPPGNALPDADAVEVWT
ncbi:MAG: hypothetical protein R3B48_04120 [Kofleriaceae bacterium]